MTVFFAEEFSECDDAIGYQFRVLDEIDGMADEAVEQTNKRVKSAVS